MVGSVTSQTIPFDNKMRHPQFFNEVERNHNLFYITADKSLRGKSCDELRCCFFILEFYCMNNKMVNERRKYYSENISNTKTT